METNDRMSRIHRKQFHMSGAVLKNIAYAAMFIDHFFAIIVQGYIWMTAVDGVWNPQLTVIYRTGRAIGRIAFILFAHQIVEGFLHTRSRGRFLMRLGLFALISEIPFDLAFSGSVIDWSNQNIFWTLFIGVIILTLWESFERYHGTAGRLLRYGVVAIGCTIAYFGNTDYRYMGVLLIFALYRTHDKNLTDRMVWAGIVMLFGTWSANCLRYLSRGYSMATLFHTSMREMYGLAAFVPIAFYDGSRGRQFPKWFCYGFYPIHLLFLYGAAIYIGVW